MITYLPATEETSENTPDSISIIKISVVSLRFIVLFEVAYLPAHETGFISRRSHIIIDPLPSSSQNYAG